MSWTTTKSAAGSPPPLREFQKDLLRSANRIEKGLRSHGDKKVGLNNDELPGMLKKYGISEEVIQQLGHDYDKMEQVLKTRVCLQDCVNLYIRSQAEQMSFLTGIYHSNKTWSGTDSAQLQIAAKRVLDFDQAQIQVWARAAEQQQRLLGILASDMPALTNLDTVHNKQQEAELAALALMLQLSDEAKADFIETVPGPWRRVENCQSNEQCDGTEDELSEGRIPRYGGVCVQNRCYDSNRLHEWITDKQKKGDCVTDRYGHEYTVEEIQRVEEANQRGYEIFYENRCGYCRKALDLVKTNHLKYKSYDLKDSANKKQLKRKLKADCTTIPQVFFNGEHIGGYTELEKHTQRIIL